MASGNEMDVVWEYWENCMENRGLYAAPPFVFMWSPVCPFTHTMSSKFLDVFRGRDYAAFLNFWF